MYGLCQEFTPCSAACSLSKDCSCKGEIRPGATPVDGKGSKEGTTIPQLDAPHLSLFKELLRDRLVANLMSEGGVGGANGFMGSKLCHYNREGFASILMTVIHSKP